MIKVERIDHVGFYVRDLEKAAEFFSDLFGLKFSPPFVSDAQDGTPLAREVMDYLGVDLLSPATPDGELAKVIERRGEGLNALSFKVPDLEDAIVEMQSRGIRLVRRRERQGVKWATFHPKDLYGVFIELIEYHPMHPVVQSRFGHMEG